MSENTVTEAEREALDAWHEWRGDEEGFCNADRDLWVEGYETSKDVYAAKVAELRALLAEVNKAFADADAIYRSTEARLTAVARLVGDAERGESIVITPGFSEYKMVDAGLLRHALNGTDPEAGDPA